MKIKTSILFFVFLIFSGQVFFSQNPIADSLLKVIAKPGIHDTTKISAYNSLSQLSVFSNIDTVLCFSTKAKFVAEQSLLKKPEPFVKKRILLLLARAFDGIGYVYDNRSNSTKALEYYFRSLNLQLENGDQSGAGTSLSNIAGVYDNLGKTEIALRYYDLSLALYVQMKNKQGIANVYNNLGYIYNNQGNIGKSLEFFHLSLKMKEELRDLNGTAYSLNNIGYIYDLQGNTSKAIEYYEKSLQIHKQTGDKQGISTELNNMGALYNTLGDRDKALFYFKESLKMQESSSDQHGLANSLNNIGFVYNTMNDLPKALEYYNKGLEMQQKIGDKEGEALSLNNIGSVYLKNSNYPKALDYAKKSFDLAKELGFPELIKNSASLLTKIYQKQNKPNDAFEMYKLEIQMRDSISNEENTRKTVQQQMQYEFDKKESEVKAQREKRDLILLEEKQRQAVILWFTFAGLLLVIVFSGFMFNRYRVTQKQKNIIEIKERETQQQKKIIEVKAAELSARHKEITDSINYAERIQRSFLASSDLLNRNLPDYFILFKPKDVVSGDFYWASILNNGHFAFVTADSTGHGVPGAIMSLLNITSLEKAVELNSDPAEILNATRQNIIERLKMDGSADGGKDGMDCSVIVFDFSKKQLHLAAANNPVWIVRKNEQGLAELIEIKPDKMPVGKNDQENESFTTRTIDVQSGDMVYALTDGFADQFGGPRGKKFMSKNLKEVLRTNSYLSPGEQKILLDATFKNWVADLEQVDDVTIVGIKI